MKRILPRLWQFCAEFSSKEAVSSDLLFAQTRPTCDGCCKKHRILIVISPQFSFKNAKFIESFGASKSC
jgi:hypothetical protein